MKEAMECEMIHLYQTPSWNFLMDLHGPLTADLYLMPEG